MKPIGGPIGGDISSVPPYGAHLLTSERLPNVLAVFDLLPGEDNHPSGRDDPLGSGWRLAVNLSAVVAQNKKRDNDDYEEAKPQAGVSHCVPFRVYSMSMVGRSKKGVRPRFNLPRLS